MSTAPRPSDLRHLIQVPNFLGHRPGTVRSVQGTVPSGEPVEFEVTERPWTLLVFLTSACDGCEELWRAFADPESLPFPRDVDVVVVTRGPRFEGPDKVACLAGSGSVVMSDDAWTDYGVHTGPFYVLVDGSAVRVVTEGVAWSLEQIASAVSTARGDA